MATPIVQLQLYAELANWWHLLSAPEDYTHEAEFYIATIKSEMGGRAKTVLEFGSGGGNSASHFKKHFQMTLVDLSQNMLNVSKQLNPECEHFLGDMIDTRLEREFDVVYLHDAIAYISSEADLKKTIETAFAHCRPGGMAMIIPDFTRDNFKNTIVTGGHDKNKRGMRYMEWIWDPNPNDTLYLSDMVYMLKDENGNVRCVHDRHELGLFSKDKWMKLMSAAGFQTKAIPFDAHQDANGETYFFIGHKRG